MDPCAGRSLPILADKLTFAHLAVTAISCFSSLFRRRTLSTVQVAMASLQTGPKRLSSPAIQCRSGADGQNWDMIQFGWFGTGAK
jgi:hypothetical protein